MSEMPFNRGVIFVLILGFLGASSSFSQSSDGKLIRLVPNLFSSATCEIQTPDLTGLMDLGGGFLCLESRKPLASGVPHDPTHFQGQFQDLFNPLNSALGSQLTSLVLPSPASGVTYVFDPTTGLPTRSTQSFGPVLSERAETIGQGRWSFGFNWQYYSFDTLDGIDLDNLPFAFFHVGSKEVGGAGGGGLDDIVITQTSIDISANVFTFFLTYGLRDWLDTSVAIPVSSVEATATGSAELLRIGSGDPEIHFFSPPTGNRQDFRAEDKATGIGDIVLRFKGTPFKGETASVALGVNLRLPTGDEEDFLGSGAAGVNPFGVVSFDLGNVTPHFVVGYQWNGDSVLAGDPQEGSVLGDLPDQFFYQAVADISLSPHFTFDLGFLGQRVFDSTRFFLSPRVIDEMIIDPGSTGIDSGLIGTTIADITSQVQSFNLNNGVVGVKVGGEKFLATFNLLFKLNDSGLRDKITPLVGLELYF